MKKMRRLIPAIAMLLVSAVMLSTASFAWFTMNTEVEATGMTVQAKSDGSMVIDTNPLTALSTGWEAQFAPLGNKKLVPVSHGTYKAASLAGEGVVGDANGFVIDSVDSNGWYTAFDSKLVDSMTGETQYFKAITPSKDVNYVDYTVYIGLASESEVKNIKVELNTTSTLHIAGAYAIAFYVDEDITDDVAIDYTTPATVLHCGEGTNNGVASIQTDTLFDAPVTIPSTIGVDGTNVEAVGIQVVMRVFIDGNLKDGLQYTPKKATYKAATGNYDPKVSYFVAETDSEGNVTGYVPATINENDYIDNVAADGTVTYKAVDSTWKVFDAYVDDTANTRDTFYVSNSHAPSAPSALDVSFELVD